MIQRILHSITTPPANHAQYRRFFGFGIAACLVVLCVEAITSWYRRHPPPLSASLSDAGVLLMLIFFYSRQPSVRLVSWFGAFVLLTVGLVLNHFR